MYSHIIVKDYIYTPAAIENDERIIGVINNLGSLSRMAFGEIEEDALLEAHRMLYVINMAALSRPWDKPAHNIGHPHIARIKYILENSWEQAERLKYSSKLVSIPEPNNFTDWITNLVQGHSSHDVHPLYYFLKEQANFAQLRQFTLQETPLEMLFGDIVALMMPGVYGDIKLELIKNFWDEVGHAVDARIHRNLRANLMCQLDIDPDFYQTDVEVFVREELALVNLYLSMAMNRAKLTQLIGVMLATELMIPGRFEFLIKGWNRLGLKDEAMVYLTEHVSVDEKHAKDWLYQVVNPLLETNPELTSDLVLGVLRRLDTAAAVSDRMMRYLPSQIDLPARPRGDMFAAMPIVLVNP